MSTSISSSTSRKSSGFTIIEIMVTIGILVLIAAGVSAIFSSVADTVNSGKRVSELNRYAAQFERIMREDFENMTRDGFLVIVHQNAPGADPLNNRHDVQLSPADSSDEDNNNEPGRPRRVDEIMFFARAEFETARRAISPGMIAKSGEAAIYYGHGQRALPDLRPGTMGVNNDTNYFFNPDISNENFKNQEVSAGVHQGWLGVPSGTSFNPNQYASDWSLLRHVTLLTNPQSSGQDLPDEVFGIERIDDREWLEDSARQVSLQPALQTIFGSLNKYSASSPLPNWFKEYSSGGFTSPTDTEAYRVSGLMDIVTADIPSIANVVRYGPGDGSWMGSLITLQNSQNPFDDYKALLDTGASIPISIEPTQWANPTSAIAQQRLWMLDALPSRWDLNDPPTQLSRVRYETIPTRLLFEDDAFANDRARTYAEADQEMLGASVFIPKCTEFIVEWSNGYYDQTITAPDDPDYKRMRWYGLPRGIDEDDNGFLDPTEIHFADRYYARPAAGLNADQIARERYLSHLVMGHDEATQFDTELSMFAFEYNNPDIADDASTANIDESVVDWPWPKFIRVTVSIADPLDTTIEHTFQMVFNIPDVTNN